MTPMHDPAAGRPTTEGVRRTFSTIASRYDLFNSVSSLGLDRYWRSVAVRHAELTPRSVVLDVAAGTGDLTMAIARQGRPKSVMSTDFVAEMLDVARKKAQDYQGPTAVEFEVADAQALPFDDASFDVVTVAFGVRNMPDRAANFREAKRVLKPGGRYVVLEFSRPPFVPFRSMYYAYLKTVIPVLGTLLTGDRPSFLYLGESIRAFPSQMSLARELYAAGFKKVSWHNLTLGIVAIHVAQV